MSLYVDEYLATGDVPGPGHDLLTGRYACYDVYEASDGGWLSVGCDRAALLGQPLPRCSACEQWRRQPDRRRRAGRDPRRLPRPRFNDEDPRRLGRRARPRRHLRRAGADRPRGSSTTRSSRARGAFVDAHAPDRRRPSARSARCSPGMRPRPSRPDGPRRDRRPTPTTLLARRRATPPTRSPRSATKESSHERRRRRSAAPTSSADRRAAVRGDGRVPGRARLHLDVAAPRSRTATRCSGTTTSPTRSPAGRSRRRRCSRCGSARTTGRPGRTEPQALPLQVHFDLKETLRPARGGDERQHDRLPRAGPARRPDHAPARSCGR